MIGHKTTLDEQIMKRKTLAAEIAGTKKIDVMGVIASKYIGETEKNLSQVVRKVEKKKVILQFDEADALFGKRTEVKDAHDRFANM